MKAILISVLLAACLFVPAAAEPVRWTIASGGNGHLYEVVSFPEPVTWAQASGRALEAGGRLATVTSPDEDAWLVTNIVVPYVQEALTGGPWIGGFINTLPPAPRWDWVTGETFAYTRWAVGEPSGYPAQNIRYGPAPDYAWEDINIYEDPCYAIVVEYCDPDVSGRRHSLAFDGVDDDVVSQVSLGLPTGADDRTIEFWVKSDEYAQPNTCLVGWGGGTIIGGSSAICIGSDGTPDRRLYFWDGYHEFIWRTPLQDGDWYHVAFTLENGWGKFYLNGELDESGQVPGLNTLPDYYFGLGRPRLTEMGRFRGNLMEMRIWDRALTRAEIAERMNTRLDPVAGTGLVGCWHLDEGAGSVAHDESISSLNGAIYGAAWSDDVPLEPVRLEAKSLGGVKALFR